MRDLVQQPRSLRQGPGWREELLGALPEMFYEVRRTVLAPGAVAQDGTAGRFHVLNVVQGDGIVLQPKIGHGHVLAYAETMVVPAAVGPYSLQCLGSEPVMVIKALVR